MGDTDESDIFGAEPFFITTKTDKRPSVVVAVEILPDGKYLICDMENQKLKLFTDEGKFVNEVTFPDEPSSMVVWNEQEIVVAFPDGEDTSLRKVNINILGDQLELGEFIKTNLETKAVAALTEGKLFTIATDDDENQYIQIINEKGKVETKERLDYEIDFNQYSLGVSPDKNVVYMIDNETTCIGVNTKGEKVFTYDSKDENRYGGVVVDKHGFIYLGTDQDNEGNITKLSPDGTFIEIMFPEFSTPQVVPMKLVKDKMFVAVLNTDTGEEKTEYVGFINM